MNKQFLRTLGIGFLSAAILTGAFAVFGQGHVPIAGITVNSLFNASGEDTAQLSQFRDEISQLQEQNSQLESEKRALSESLSQKAKEESSEKASNEASESSSTSANTIEPTSETTTQAVDEEPAKEGVFTISEGEASSTIAERLQADGYIDDATELQDLISYWGLDSMIVVGDYNLNSDMSVHQIAELITNGAYYYIP